jgi:predicted kinase
MEAVVFIGLQASGKSSFYRQQYFDTHVRISLDLLRTRHRECRFLEACLKTQQPFVVDNTNPSRDERAEYLSLAKAARYTVVGYYFRSSLEECLNRNQCRPQPIPEKGVLATAKRLQLPTLVEGFDALRYVRLMPTGFVIEEWCDEL